MRDILMIGGNSGVGEKPLQRLLDRADVRLSTANRTGWEDTPSGVRHQTYDAADDGSVLQLPELLHGLVYRVRFNLIAPSLTDTPLAAGLLNSERKREAAEQRTPSNRWAIPTIWPPWRHSCSPTRARGSPGR
jgi:hypothetical protein